MIKRLERSTFRRALNRSPWCRETPLFRIATRMIAVIFSSLDPFWHELYTINVINCVWSKEWIYRYVRVKQILVSSETHRNMTAPITLTSPRNQKDFLFNFKAKGKPRARSNSAEPKWKPKSVSTVVYTRK